MACSMATTVMPSRGRGGLEGTREPENMLGDVRENEVRNGRDLV
jgi:hypothetical protein